MVQANLQMSPTESHAHMPFFRRRWVQTILPMGTSLAVHLGIAIAGYFAYRVATNYIDKSEIQTHPVTFEYEPALPPGQAQVPVPTVGIGNKPEDRLGNNFDTAIPDSPTFNPKNSKVLSSSLGGPTSDGAESNDIGIGPRRNKGGPGGLSIGDVGEIGNVRIGTPRGTSDIGGTFLPPKILASKVVFVCDATGSMQAIFGSLRDVLQDRIKKLEINQAFNVVFFSDDKVLSLNPQNLLLATPDNKTKAYNFLGDVSPRGLTNPIPAIRAAFAQQPEVMYVLTDGFDQVESLESVYNEFATLNKAGKVQVHTILVGSGEQKELVDILQRIAKDNRGTMKIVSRDVFDAQ